MKVSVIVPVYKVEKYLKKCIDSILNQTYRDLEVILVDDGSPDQCGAICDRYGREDSRVHVIHKENGGLSDARNTGVECASGEYILFVDSDDYIDPELVEKTVKAAEKTGCDLVMFDYIREEENFSLPCYSELPEGQVLTLEKNPEILISTLSAWSKLYKRAFYLECGHWFPKGRLYEDLGSIPKIFLDAKSIVYVRGAFYHYLIRQGSIMTSTALSKNFTDRTAMCRASLDYFRDCGKWQQFHDELEYLAFRNIYFEPSKEIILADRKSPYLKRFKDYMAEAFPGYHDNPYLRNLTPKERLHYKIIETKQYWMMVALSYARRAVEKIKTRR